MQNGSYMEGTENENNTEELYKLLNKFFNSNDYQILQLGFKTFNYNNLNLNNLVSKLMRMS